MSPVNPVGLLHVKGLGFMSAVNPVGLLHVKGLGFMSPVNPVGLLHVEQYGINSCSNTLRQHTPAVPVWQSCCPADDHTAVMRPPWGVVGTSQQQQSRTAGRSNTFTLREPPENCMTHEGRPAGCVRVLADFPDLKAIYVTQQSQHLIPLRPGNDIAEGEGQLRAVGGLQQQQQQQQ
jgi:hypothetical protein